MRSSSGRSDHCANQSRFSSACHSRRIRSVSVTIARGCPCGTAARGTRTCGDGFQVGPCAFGVRSVSSGEADDDLGLIVADSRHREDDNSLRRFFGALTESGTP